MESIMMVVNSGVKEGLAVSTEVDVERFVIKHGFSRHKITYSDLKGVDDSLRKFVFESIGLTKTNFYGKSLKLRSFLNVICPSKREKYSHEGNAENHPAYLRTVTPFLMEEVASQTERFGPWGPERVILFGRTGSGKSTLARMLTVGELGRAGKAFEPHPSIRGETREILKPKIGRGWYVLDTPGFGESPLAMSTREVEAMVERYVRMVEGTFAHYIYVWRKGILDTLDKKLWQFFVFLFGDDIKEHFTVVVVGADEGWMLQNRLHLQDIFHGCTSFLSADFPAIVNDEELEREYEKMRTESLLGLENYLAEKNQFDRQFRQNKGLEIRNSSIQNLVRRADVIFSFYNPSSWYFSELTNALRGIALMPV